MKKAMAAVLLLTVLSGCASGGGETMDRVMALRSKILSQTSAFCAEVTVNYGDRSCTFTMDCTADPEGNVTFEVKKPDSISGIRGKISAAGGKLTFEDKLLAFDSMAEGRLSPAAAPWLMMKTLRSGYLTSCSADSPGLRAGADDSYEQQALHMDFWLDSGDLPVQCDIFWEGRRLVSIAVSHFRFL